MSANTERVALAKVFSGLSEHWGLLTVTLWVPVAEIAKDEGSV